MNISSTMQSLRAVVRRWLPGGRGHVMHGHANSATALLATVLLASPLAHAGFTNGDFESGSISGWSPSPYTNNGIATFPPLTRAHLGLANGAPAGYPVTTGVVTSPPGTSTNPDAPMPPAGQGKFKIPFQGTYSARVNARGDKGRAGGIFQQATMQESDRDPSDGKVHVRMALSPVIQSAPHPYTQQPYFFIEVRNVTKGTQLFYTFNFSNQPGAPWQNVGGYEYTGWQAIDVAPGNGLLDPGDVVSVEIIASGCYAAAGGHSGEVYVDTIGPFFAGLMVAATGPTTSKPSDNVTYTYNYSNTSGVMVFDGKVVIKAPQGMKTGASPTTPSTADFVNATYVTSTGATCTQIASNPDALECEVGTLADKASGSFNITWTVPSNASTSTPTNVLNHGDYEMSATGASSVRGPMVQTQLLGTGATLTDLAVTVSDGTTAVAPNGTTTYTVTVTNNGPADVVNAPLSQIVSNLTVGNWACNGSVPDGTSCSAASGTGTIAGLTLTIPAGKSITLQVPAVVGSSGSASTTFTVATPGGITDSNTGNNTAGDTDQIGILRTLEVTKSGSGTGTVVTSERDLLCDTGGSPVCSINVADGSTKFLTATAGPGSIFTGWTSGPCAGATTNPCTISNITANTEVDAAFALAYVVTPTLSGGHGSIGPTTPTQVVENNSVVYTLTPDPGYYSTITTSTCASGTLDTSVTPNTYTVAPVTADCGFTVAFTQGVTITPSVAGGNGAISPSVPTAPLPPGSNNTVYTLTPNAGYVPVMGGTCQGVFNGSVIPNTYTVTNATADCTVIASFTNDPVTVTSSTSGGHGSIDTTGTINLPNGGSRTYTLVPDAGYYPLITGNCPGTLVGNTYTVSPVTANCAFDVAFTNATVDITATVTSGAGTVTPPGTTTVAQGGGQTYTATPGGGNVAVFEDTTTCPGVRSGNVYNVANAAANCAVNVKFVAAASAITVTATVPGGNGTVTTPGQNAAGETVLAPGDTRVWTLTPSVAGMVPHVLPGSTCVGTLSATAPFTYTVTNAAASCAVAFAFAAPAPASIPTLSEWGLIVLSVLMGLFMVGMQRRRKL